MLWSVQDIYIYICIYKLQRSLLNCYSKDEQHTSYSTHDRTSKHYGWIASILQQWIMREIKPRSRITAKYLCMVRDLWQNIKTPTPAKGVMLPAKENILYYHVVLISLPKNVTNTFKSRRILFHNTDKNRLWPSKIRPLRCPETSVPNYQPTMVNMPEERKPQD